MTDLPEALLAVRAAKRVAPGVPVVATMTFDPTPRGIFTVMGVTPARAAAALGRSRRRRRRCELRERDRAMVAVVAELAQHAVVPLAVRPNAGLPRLVDGVLAWPETPEFFAIRLPRSSRPARG